MFHGKKGSSLKQMAYARRVYGAQGTTKKEIALDVGYSPNVANSVKSHIENKLGYHNAMAKLAADSNNLALKVMEEFKARGFKDFTNKDLVGALNAIGSAWSKFNDATKPKEKEPSTNRLRTVILQQVENQVISPENPAAAINPSPEKVEVVEAKEDEVIDIEVEDPNDF